MPGTCDKNTQTKEPRWVGEYVHAATRAARGARRWPAISARTLRKWANRREPDADLTRDQHRRLGIPGS
jgi:hypothetical protein